MWQRLTAAGIAALAALSAAGASAADKVTFATNWKAEAEHGGFYQASPTAPTRSTGSK
jgi:NitT/TauT family transport system substrate-binding protein